MRTTEVVDLAEEQVPPHYGACYASGSTFRPTAKNSTAFVVETGKRRLVSRVLCISHYYKHRCEVCPYSQGELRLLPRGVHE